MAKITSSQSKSIAVGKDWTKGSIIQNILLISWPMIVLGVLYAFNLILEMIWVGKLGAASIAGVGVSGIVVLLVVAVKTGLGAGETALVARFVGGGDIAEANHVAGQAFVISAVYGVIIAAIGILFTEQIFSLFSLDADAVAEGTTYLRIVLAGWSTEAFWMTSFSVMQFSGDTITPMKIAVIIRVVNALICPFMVLGWWIFPRLGVSGAAITYIFTTGLGMVICFWVLFTGKTRLRLTLKDFYPDLKIIWRILKIGIPASIMMVGKSFGDLIFTWFMIPFGTIPLAAHNLISRIESFVNTPGRTIAKGAGVLVGQNLGANQPNQASRSGWLSTGLVSGFMVLCSVILLLWPENIIALFNVEPYLIHLGAVFLKISITGFLGMSIVYVLQSCISGAGDTMPPMLINLAMLWMVQLPLAFLLSRHTGLGVYGVRWAIVIGIVIGAIAFIVYFWGGRWKRKKL
ncbi:MAG: MATE family efflux transporter [Deltaproteobacteria bacterium]|nr:MATE family efflux transporter [Deltaproteobacteria bacterium]